MLDRTGQSSSQFPGFADYGPGTLLPHSWAGLRGTPLGRSALSVQHWGTPGKCLQSWFWPLFLLRQSLTGSSLGLRQLKKKGTPDAGTGFRVLFRYRERSYDGK